MEKISPLSLSLSQENNKNHERERERERERRKGGGGGVDRERGGCNWRAELITKADGADSVISSCAMRPVPAERRVPVHGEIGPVCLTALPATGMGFMGKTARQEWHKTWITRLTTGGASTGADPYLGVIGRYRSAEVALTPGLHPSRLWHFFFGGGGGGGLSLFFFSFFFFYT